VAGGFADGDQLTARFNTPTGLAIDARGDLWIGDQGNNRIRRVVRTSGACSIGGACFAASQANPANACQACKAATAWNAWTAKGAGEACSDGSYCTLTDVCGAGGCAGSANTCDDGNACTNDSCTAATGACVHTPTGGPGC
jgi:hypothetical protein